MTDNLRDLIDTVQRLERGVTGGAGDLRFFPNNRGNAANLRPKAGHWEGARAMVRVDRKCEAYV